MAKIMDTNKAFLMKLQALYDIEKQLEKALPKMAKAADDGELKNGFLLHLEETKKHSARLEQIFEMMDASPKKATCEGIRGIIEDALWVMDTDAPDPLHDSMIAGAARYAEHYEMAGYLSAIEEARALNMDAAADLLSATLAEEEMADQKLAAAMKKGLQMLPQAM